MAAQQIAETLCLADDCSNLSISMPSTPSALFGQLQRSCQPEHPVGILHPQSLFFYSLVVMLLLLVVLPRSLTCVASFYTMYPPYVHCSSCGC